MQPGCWIASRAAKLAGPTAACLHVVFWLLFLISVHVSVIFTLARLQPYGLQRCTASLELDQLPQMLPVERARQEPNRASIEPKDRHPTLRIGVQNKRATNPASSCVQEFDRPNEQNQLKEQASQHNEEPITFVVAPNASSGTAMCTRY